MLLAGGVPGGLGRLGRLNDAVRAAGAPVSVAIEGEQVPLPPPVDHAAYRILQESLTNVLRHAGPDASAEVCLHESGVNGMKAGAAGAAVGALGRGKNARN